MHIRLVITNVTEIVITVSQVLTQVCRKFYHEIVTSLFL